MAEKPFLESGKIKYEYIKEQRSEGISWQYLENGDMIIYLGITFQTAEGSLQVIHTVLFS